jgi:choline dehydrogenase-like flavoprotein
LDQDARASVLPLGGHHIGTARMSESPSSGVVNSDGRVHFVNNLYVAGSATFPTSGHANPILTIVAMALRLAQHLEMRLGNRLV